MKVSVVIPAYNAAQTLSRAIESVLQQSHSPFEVIVVNDESQDETLTVARRYTPDVRVVDVPHGGVSAARNRGIDVSSGDWIAFLDADDEWKREKLSIQIAKSKGHPMAMLLASGAQYERDGKIYKATRVRKSGRLVRDLLLDNVINTSTVMVRRESLESPRLRFPVGVGFGEDWELWVTLASLYEIALIPDVLVRTFRMSTNSSAAIDGESFGAALVSAYDRLRQTPSLQATIADMWPELSANLQYKKANFLYDRGCVSAGRKLLLQELRRGERMPPIDLAIKILLMPLALRNRINRVVARGSLVGSGR